MHLFLIRHGETVDNVAGITAGVRDSPLTTHGFQQATRLGQFFHAAGIDFTHVFASPLQRAFMTAEQVVIGQQSSKPITANTTQSLQASQLSVLAVPELREMDFGLFEGVHYRSYKLENEWMQTVETADAMEGRADSFVETCLLPVLQVRPAAVVAVVSHGRFLQTLWQRILLRIKPVKVVCEQQLLIDSRSFSYNAIGAWSNTGYLEVEFLVAEEESRVAPTSTAVPPVSSSEPVPGASTSSADIKPVQATVSINEDDSSTNAGTRVRWIVKIAAINGRQHLVGFKKNRGVGSAAYDARQGTLDGFFKRPAT
jgi:broad specificity phosphatase PhoE